MEKHENKNDPSALDDPYFQAQREARVAERQRKEAWIATLPPFEEFLEQRPVAAQRADRIMERIAEIYSEYEKKDAACAKRDDLAILTKRQVRELEKGAAYLESYDVREIQEFLLDVDDLLHDAGISKCIKRIARREHWQASDATKEQS